jgi:ABC-2 type transport system ATP-binding protein
MTGVLELREVTKRFGRTVALDRITLDVPTASVTGLIGKNGSGKTTLIRHAIGLYLPTSGACVTLGCPTADLGAAELSRIGVVQQDGRFLYWMRVGQQIRYIASFYPRWDLALEERLVAELELDRDARIGALSPGNAQKLGILLAVCHHPELLLLDEPLSALDPIARQSMLSFLLELFREHETTIVISSHVLRDIEQIVDRIICLDRGTVTADAPLDELHDRYAEWIVTSPVGELPERFPEDFILQQHGDRRRAQLVVADATDRLETFSSRWSALVETRPLNLERIFPFLVSAQPILR